MTMIRSNQSPDLSISCSLRIMMLSVGIIVDKKPPQKENPLLEPFIAQILYAKNWYTGTNISATQTALRDLIDTFPEPAATPSLKVKQDQTLIINTAKKIQQTL